MESVFESQQDENWDEFLESGLKDLSVGSLLRNGREKLIEKSKQLNIEINSDDDVDTFYSALFDGLMKALKTNAEKCIEQKKQEQEDERNRIISEILRLMRDALTHLVNELGSEESSKQFKILKELEKSSIKLQDGVIEVKCQLNSQCTEFLFGFVSTFKKLILDQYYRELDRQFNELESSLVDKSSEYATLRGDAEKYKSEFEKLRSEELKSRHIDFINLVLARAKRAGTSFDVAKYQESEKLIEACSDVIVIRALKDSRGYFKIKKKVLGSKLEKTCDSLIKDIDDFLKETGVEQKNKISSVLSRIIINIKDGMDNIYDHINTDPDQIAQFIKDAKSLIMSLVFASDDMQNLLKEIEEKTRQLIIKVDQINIGTNSEKGTGCEYFSDLERLAEVLRWSRFKQNNFCDIPVQLGEFNDEMRIDEHRRCLYGIYEDLKRQLPELVSILAIYNDKTSLLGDFLEKLFRSILHNLASSSPADVRKAFDTHCTQKKEEVLSYKNIKTHSERIEKLLKEDDFLKQSELLKKCYLNLIVLHEPEKNINLIAQLSNKMLDNVEDKQDLSRHIIDMIIVYSLPIFRARMLKHIQRDGLKSLRPYLDDTLAFMSKFLSSRDQLSFYVAADPLFEEQSKKVKSDDKSNISEVGDNFTKEIIKVISEKLDVSEDCIVLDYLEKTFAVNSKDRSVDIQQSLKILTLIPLVFYNKSTEESQKVLEYAKQMLSDYHKEKHSPLRLDLCSLLLKLALRNRSKEKPEEQDLTERFCFVIYRMMDELKSDENKNPKLETQSIKDDVLIIIEAIAGTGPLKELLDKYEDKRANSLCTESEITLKNAVKNHVFKRIMKNTNSNLWLETLIEAYIIQISEELVDKASVKNGGQDCAARLVGAVGDANRHAIVENVEKLLNASSLPAIMQSERNILSLLTDTDLETKKLDDRIRCISGLKKKMVISLSYAKNRSGISAWVKCISLILEKIKSYSDFDHLGNLLDVLMYYDNLDEYASLVKEENGAILLFMQYFFIAIKKSVIMVQEAEAFLKDSTNFDVHRFDFSLGHKCLLQLSNLLLTRVSKDRPTLSFSSFKKLFDLILSTNAYYNKALLDRVDRKDFTVWWIELKSEEIMRKFSLASDDNIEFKSKFIDCYLLFEKKYKNSDIDAFVMVVKEAKKLDAITLYGVLKQFQSNRWVLNASVLSILKEIDASKWLSKDTDTKIQGSSFPKLEKGQRSVSQIIECIKGDASGVNQSILSLISEKMSPEGGLQNRSSSYDFSLKQVMQQIEDCCDEFAKNKPTKEAIQVWATTFKALGPAKLKNLENVVELCAVFRWVVKDCEGYFPRNTQMIALLCFIHGINNQVGRIANISTGEGKTLITQLLAITRALNNEKVDVITSSSVYAQRDAKAAVKIMGYFGISVNNNCDSACESEDVRRKRYAGCQVIYGDTGAFQRDFLLTQYMEKNIRHNGRGDCVIIDEADSALIDNASKTLYISHSIEDLQHFRDLFVLIWSAIHNPELFVRSDKNVAKVIKLIESQVEDGSLKVPLSETMVAFRKRRMKIWVNNAYAARDLSEGDQYTIAKESSKKGQALVMDLGTGVEQLNTQWSNGLHQFVQIKHRNKLTDESLKAVFISNLAFFREYKANVNGMTGTLGGPDDRKFMHDFYSGLDFFILPRFKPERFIMEEAIIMPTVESWQKAIIEDTNEKLDVKEAGPSFYEKTSDHVNNTEEEIKKKASQIYLLIDDPYTKTRVIARDRLRTIFNSDSEKLAELIFNTRNNLNVKPIFEIIKILFLELYKKDNKFKDAILQCAIRSKLISQEKAKKHNSFYLGPSNAAKKTSADEKTKAIQEEIQAEIQMLIESKDIIDIFLNFGLSTETVNAELIYCLIQLQDQNIELFELQDDGSLKIYKLREKEAKEDNNTKLSETQNEKSLKISEVVKIEPKKFDGKCQKRAVFKTIRQGQDEFYELKEVLENLEWLDALIHKYGSECKVFRNTINRISLEIPALEDEIQKIQMELDKIRTKFSVTEESKKDKTENLQQSITAYKNLLESLEKAPSVTEETALADNVSTSNNTPLTNVGLEKEDRKVILHSKIKQLEKDLEFQLQIPTRYFIQTEHNKQLSAKEEAIAKLSRLKGERDELLEKESLYQSNIQRYQKVKQGALLSANQKNPRAILAICENQLTARALYGEVMQRYPLKALDFGESEHSPYKDKKVIRYDSALKEFKHEALAPGDVIIATNIAGRGMDLETIDQLESNQGLHVGLTFIPEDDRTSIQNFGRTARKGHEGSGRYIVYDPRAATQQLTISMLLDERDERASARMAQLRQTQIPRMLIEEKLFKQFMALQNTVRQNMRSDKMEEEFVQLQIKSLQDRWAFWLDLHEEDLANVYKLGEDYLLSHYQVFLDNAHRDMKLKKYGFIDSAGELYRLARFYFNKQIYNVAEECYDQIILLEGPLSGFAHYYKAQAIFGQDKRVELAGKRLARDHLKLAIKKLVGQLQSLATANQIIKVMGDNRQVRGQGLEVDYFTASNVNLMSFISIHIDAAKEVLGQELSEKVLTSGPIVGEEVKKTYEYLRTSQPLLVKDYRISHKLESKYELFWKKYTKLPLDSLSDPILKTKLESAKKRLIVVKSIADADKKKLEEKGISCKKVIVRQQEGRETIVRFSALFSPINDEIVEIIEKACNERNANKKEWEATLRGSKLSISQKAYQTKLESESFKKTIFTGKLFSKEQFAAILKKISIESMQYRLCDKFEENALGAEWWQKGILIGTAFESKTDGKGLDLKKRMLSNRQTHKKEELEAEIKACFTGIQTVDIQKVIDNLCDKEKGIFVPEAAYELKAGKIEKLSELVKTINLRHALSPEEFKFLDLEQTNLANRSQDLFQKLSANINSVKTADLGINEAEFELLWAKLDSLNYLKYNIYDVLELSEEKNNIPSVYQPLVESALVSMFLKHKTSLESKTVVRIPESAIPFTHNLEESIESLWNQLIQQDVLKKPSVRFPLTPTPEIQFNDLKDHIRKQLDGLLVETNKELFKKISDIKREAEKYSDYDGAKGRALFDELNKLVAKRKEYQDTIEKVFETIIGKIKYFEKLKISKKTLDDYLKDGKMPPEIVDFTRRCLFEVLSLMKDAGFNWDAFLCAVLGVLQIVAGCILNVVGAPGLGQILIREGIGDIVYAIQSGISGNFSWDAYADRKLLSLAISIATVGFSAIVSGEEFIGPALHNVEMSTIVNSVGQAVLKNVLEAFVEVGVNLAATALIDVGSKSILEGLVNALVDGIHSSPKIKELEKTLEGRYEELYKKFGEEDSNAICKKLLQDGNLGQAVQSKVSAHALRYFQMALQGLSKLSNSGNSTLKTIGNISQALGMIGSYASSVKVATEIVGDVEGVLRDMVAELDEMHSSKKPRNEKGDVNDPKPQKFAKEKHGETMKIVIDQAKAVVNNAVLTPILQSGLKYVADGMTESFFKSLQKDADELRERAKIESVLERDDKTKFLSAGEKAQYVHRLSQLKGGSIHNASDVMKKQGGTAEVILSSGRKTLSEALAGKDENTIFLSKKEDGYHVIELDFKQALEESKNNSMSGDFSLWLLASHAHKKIVLLDPDTFQPHEKAPAGFEPLGGEADGEITLVMNKNGQLSPCHKGNDGRWVVVDPSVGVSSQQGLHHNEVSHKVSAAANYARKSPNRSPSGVPSNNAAENSEAIKYLYDAVNSAEQNPELKTHYDQGSLFSSSRYRLLPEGDQLSTGSDFFNVGAQQDTAFEVDYDALEIATFPLHPGAANSYNFLGGLIWGGAKSMWGNIQQIYNHPKEALQGIQSLSLDLYLRMVGLGSVTGANSRLYQRVDLMGEAVAGSLVSQYHLLDQRLQLGDFFGAGEALGPTSGFIMGSLGTGPVLRAGMSGAGAAARYGARLLGQLGEGGLNVFESPGYQEMLRVNVALRQGQMLVRDVGFNVAADTVFQPPPIGYSHIGPAGTYITDYRAIGEALGPVRANTRYNVGFFSNRNIDTLSSYSVGRLEGQLGLGLNSLGDNFRFTRVPGINNLNVFPPMEGNRFFRGQGMGLPGGGPELVTNPSIPTTPWPPSNPN